MAETCIEIAVIVSRRALDNPWVDHIWSPVAVLSDVPAAAPWTVLNIDGDVTLIYAGAATLSLHTSETANYRDNLINDTPLLWVALRKQQVDELELAQVTADPTEGEALFESGAEIVGTVAMPPDIASWIAAFVDEHHEERVFLKRKRDRAAGQRSRRGDGRDDEGGFFKPIRHGEGS
jgi:hypothetical protein